MASSKLSIFVSLASVLLYFIIACGLFWRFVGSGMYGVVYSVEENSPVQVDGRFIETGGKVVLGLWISIGVALACVFYWLQRKPSVPFAVSFLLLGTSAGLYVTVLVIAGCDLALASLHLCPFASVSFDLMISTCQTLFFALLLLHHYYRSPIKQARSSSDLGMHLIERQQTSDEET